VEQTLCWSPLEPLAGMSGPSGMPRRSSNPCEKQCPECGGNGRIKMQTTKGLEYESRCPACNGRGYGFATK